MDTIYTIKRNLCGQINAAKISFPKQNIYSKK